MTVLPITYLGGIEWFAALMRPDSVIDLGENYIKQSCRNRCAILSANGPMILTVNVVKGGSMKKRPVRDMRIDYSKRWQHEHWLSIVSAYRSSPYFDYFADYFAPMYERRFDFLADFEMSLIELVLKHSGIDRQPRISNDYVIAAEGDTDLRNRQFMAPSIDMEPYFQVFSDRFGFQPNMSIIDLLFCEGPDGVAEAVRKYGQCL